MTPEQQPSPPTGRDPEEPARPSGRRGAIVAAVVLIAIVAVVGMLVWTRDDGAGETAEGITSTRPDAEREAKTTRRRPGATAAAASPETVTRPDTAALDEGLEDVEKQQKREKARSLPDQEAAPEDLERYQRGLRRRLQAERADARQGDLLRPQLVTYLRGIVQQLLSQPEGNEILATLREDNPGPMTLEINAPYPAESVNTVPPVLLERFPRLPEGIQYRFAGCNLILLSVDTELILDYTPECLW